MSKATRNARRIKLQVYGELERIYAQVPDANCKGLCHAQCANIMAVDVERKRIEEVIGRPSRIVTTFTELSLLVNRGVDQVCGALKNGRCEAYAVRPIICRLYGAVGDNNLTCPYGCKPENPLSKEESDKLIWDTLQLPSLSE